MASAEPGSPEARRRSARFRPDEGRRVLSKVFEIDPLLRPKCGTPRKVIARVTDPVVVEKILAHRKRAGFESPFDARARSADQ